MTGSKTYLSPFKINLGLEILSKRPDGYHEINTIFYRFDEPHDTLTVSDTDQFSFTTNDPDLPTDDRNLVVRAFELCAEYHGKDLPALGVHLEKVIPSGAGLGGGSGNAATAIRIYSELIESLSPAEQLQLGSTLGADVPFFLLHARAAKATGIGATLELFHYELPYPCLVVKPRPLYASTTASYAGLKVSGKKTATDFTTILLNEHPSSWKAKVVNDFEVLAFQRYPELNTIRDLFLQHKAMFTLMSGSGGASYGLFEQELDAQFASDAFRAHYPDGFVALAK